MADLDGGQGFRVYNNWGVDGLYIRNGYDHLKATTGTSPGGSSYLELRSPGRSGDNEHRIRRDGVRWILTDPLL